jgi:CBS domain containing-hemolysin-like protein
MESDGKRFAHLWRKYKTEPERPLTAILTLNTIAHTVGALGVGTEVAKLYAGSPELDMIMGIASAILTLGVLLFSEILPKTIGTIYAKKLAVPAAFILQLLIIILIWIVAPIEWTRKLFPTPEQETVSREELVALVDVAEEEKTIESDEEEVIHNLLKLRDIKVRDVMTPRVVLSSVSANCTVQEVMEEKPIMVHGRMPVQGESIDEVMGLVLRSDILRRAAKDEDDITMQELMRPIHPVRPDQSVDEALDILLDYKEQLLIVKDEFGGTTGIITIEDIIETLLGREIVDESDQEGIDEGMVAEDMREFAKQRIDNGDSEE